MQLSENHAQNYYIDKSSFHTYNSDYGGQNMPTGLDYQGIEWKTEMSHTTRQALRENRNLKYVPFRQFTQEEVSTYPLKKRKGCEAYYMFEKFYKIPNLWCGHFQLKRNLLTPTKTDLIYPSSMGFAHYSMLDFKEKKFSIKDEFHPVGMNYYKGLVALASLDGHLAIYSLPKEKILFQNKIIKNDSINNCVTFFKPPEAHHLKCCCGGNDNSIQIFDVSHEVKLVTKYLMESPVNDLKVSPDGNLLLILEDQKECAIKDFRSGETIMMLCGHEDYGFSGDWHPCGYFVATGNQDSTCRIWDLRKPHEAINILQAHIGTVCSINYSNSGSHLVMAENVDFVNIYDVSNNYESMQVIDFFGEVTGISFDNEDGDTLFFGVMLEGRNGVFEYNLKKSKPLNILSNFMF